MRRSVEKNIQIITKNQLNKMKILNKNKIAVKVSKTESIIIDIVNPPLYYIGDDITLTEYDCRNLQLQVAKGELSHIDANRLQIKDKNGYLFEFREDGCLINSPSGYGLTSSMTLDMLGIKRRVEVVNKSN